MAEGLYLAFWLRFTSDPQQAVLFSAAVPIVGSVALAILVRLAFWNRAVAAYVLMLLLLVAGLVIGGFSYRTTSRLARYGRSPAGAPGASLVLNLRRGEGLTSLAMKLGQAGLVADPELFYSYALYVRRAGALLKAGEYELTSAMTTDELLNRIIGGQVKLYKVTIPEGYAIRDLAPLFAADKLAEPQEVARLARDAKTAAELNVPAKSLEGFLYPDTYNFPHGVTALEILKTMVHRFEQTYETGEIEAKAKRLGLTKLQAVTLASIIEKETGQPEERPLISGVFHNRLKRGMLLQTDPTVIYSVWLMDGFFNGNLTRADLQRDFPYNTYRHPGLPPGPIASPGVAALRAAVEPLATDALFFVSRNDGSHQFCPDLACHSAAVRRYQLGQ